MVPCFLICFKQKTAYVMRISEWSSDVCSSDLLFQRFMEIWSGMPTLYLLIILARVVVPNFWSLLAIMLLFTWMGFVGVVRAEFLRARNFDSFRATPALVAGTPTILSPQVLPNPLVAPNPYPPSPPPAPH